MLGGSYLKMKLSISNIAWDKAKDGEVYSLMIQYGFSGLEIAPTRVFQDAPYDYLEEAARWADEIKKNYSFKIPSMQSIWYGRSENIFVSDRDRETLISYTKKAIDFASSIGCGNLVFGCPRNRCIPDRKTSDIAISFFREISNYAVEKGTVIGMEANPSIYNTNYINDTISAIQLIQKVASKGFKLNLDIGTMIYNHEDVGILQDNVSLINHVHISEPWLKPIVERDIHGDLYKILKDEGYNRYISIEMGKIESIEEIGKVMDYVNKVFL